MYLPCCFRRLSPWCLTPQQKWHSRRTQRGTASQVMAFRKQKDRKAEPERLHLSKTKLQCTSPNQALSPNSAFSYKLTNVLINVDYQGSMITITLQKIPPLNFGLLGDILDPNHNFPSLCPRSLISISLRKMNSVHFKSSQSFNSFSIVQKFKFKVSCRTEANFFL